jgi:hypothetical protein
MGGVATGPATDLMGRLFIELVGQGPVERNIAAYH